MAIQKIWCKCGAEFTKDHKICPRCEREPDICPKCEKPYFGYPALSRRDNKTDICSTCGHKEAFEDLAKYLHEKTEKEKQEI